MSSSLSQRFNQEASHVGSYKEIVNALGYAVRSFPAETVALNGNPDKRSLWQKVLGVGDGLLEVGDRMTDGTVCIDVDHWKNKALFAPEGIFGGDATFDLKHEIAETLNKQNALGHSDWRYITDKEAFTLSNVWDEVAPNDLKGINSPVFWCESGVEEGVGGPSIRYTLFNRKAVMPVPVVRSGRAFKY